MDPMDIAPGSMAFHRALCVPLRFLRALHEHPSMLCKTWDAQGNMLGPAFIPTSQPQPPHTVVTLASPNVIVFESRNFFLFVAVPLALRKAGPFYLEGARSEAEKNHGREVVGGELL